MRSVTKWAGGPTWLTALDRSRTDARVGRECGGQEDPQIPQQSSRLKSFLEGAGMEFPFDCLSLTGW
jgi:hypothetical protein